MSGLHIQHKRNFHIIRWAGALIVLSVVAGYSYFGVRWYNTGELSPLPLPVSAADASIDETPLTDTQINEYTVSSSNPRYLEIPRLNIAKARISRVGVTERNLLDAPKNIDDSGWYAKSITPGSGSGAVLIDGHSEGVTRSGIFAKLDTLVKGDQITVERGDGKRFTYEVFDVRSMSLKDVVATGMKEMMVSADPSKEGLSLITNAGKWIPKDKVFENRVLVRATIIE